MKWILFVIGYLILSVIAMIIGKKTIDDSFEFQVIMAILWPVYLGMMIYGFFEEIIRLLKERNEE